MKQLTRRWKRKEEKETSAQTLLMMKVFLWLYNRQHQCPYGGEDYIRRNLTTGEDWTHTDPHRNKTLTTHTYIHTHTRVIRRETRERSSAKIWKASFKKDKGHILKDNDKEVTNPCWSQRQEAEEHLHLQHNSPSLHSPLTSDFEEKPSAVFALDETWAAPLR